MDVFDFRNRLIGEYGAYINSFINVQDPRIRQYIQDSLQAGHLWPAPLIQLNPSFEPGEWIDDLAKQGVLHPESSRIFKRDKDNPEYHGAGLPLRLHRHQTEAIHVARTGANYVLTTGTGSGKSLAYIVPIVDHVLRRGSGKGVQAIVVYPMNALANSQEGELTKFLKLGYPDEQGPVTFARYTGQESDETRQRIIANPARHHSHQLCDARINPHSPVRAPTGPSRARAALSGARRTAYLSRPARRGCGFVSPASA